MKHRLSMLALALLSVLGCSSGESTSPLEPEVGSYVLLSVNGAAVPTITVQNGTLTTEILSGTLTIANNGTFTESRSGRVTLAGGTPSVTTGAQSGTWDKATGQMVFTVKANGSTVATFAGILSAPHMTLTEQGTTFVYTRLETAA